MNPKQKGSSFERHICKQLSLWLTNDTREDCLWRSSMSGGRATVAAAKGKRFATQAGDISAISPEGEVLTSMFVVECKHYANLNFDGLLTKTGKLYEFWELLKKEAVKYHKKPMLVAKQNRKPTIIAVDACGLKLLSLSNHVLLACPAYDLNIVAFDKFVEHAGHDFVAVV